MKNKLRLAIGLLGAAVMATQLSGAGNAGVIPMQNSSGAFEQALPATAAQKETDRLLKRTLFNAATTTRHAGTLESFTRGPRLQHETHAAELEGAKEAINAMGSDLRLLEALRPDALPWQQLVIDRIRPLLVGAAGHATDAIERQNADRGRLPSEEYRDAVVNLYAHASQVRNLISVHMDYAEAREKLNRLDASAIAPVSQTAVWSGLAGITAKASGSLEQSVRSQLLKLPYYSVFDHLAFQVNGDQVILSGQVSWPALKADAEQAVRGVEGVETLASHIEVLPLSPNDDRIRLETYRAIYGHPSMLHYRLNVHPPIRIIVKNGDVTLVGVVGSEMDRTIAQVQANGVAGAFSVTNQLEIGS